jgi:hypothetical protein
MGNLWTFFIREIRVIRGQKRGESWKAVEMPSNFLYNGTIEKNDGGLGVLMSDENENSHKDTKSQRMRDELFFY